MKTITRQQFTQLCAALAQSYGVADVTQEFAIEPSVEQRLQDKIVEQSEFLPKINVLGVDEKTGEVILGYANGPVSGRTDTSGTGERIPQNLLGLDPKDYLLSKTNSDVYIKYDTVDAWAKFPNLAQRYTGYVQARIANDRELIGWNGEAIAENTDIATYPMLQDVNKGWMQYVREKQPENILTEGATAGEIRIGTGGDFTNLDHAVSDLIQGIPRYLRKGLVVLVGDELVSAEHAGLYKAIGATPSEKVLATTSMSLIGGLPWETPSNFPGRGLVITPYKNLSIYYQNGSWRRHIEDTPRRDRVEDFNSRNEGYVVEETRQFVALEFKDDNVKITRDGGTTWE